jgi:hypothetical protein
MRYSAFILLVIVFCIPGTLAAQGPSLVSPDSSVDVAGRVSQLEAETKALRDEVQWLRDHPVRLPEVPAAPVSMESIAPAPAPASDPAATPAPAHEAGKDEYFTLEELRGEMKKYSWKKGDFSIVPYGFLWGNMVYATERTSPGSYTLFVQSASTQPEGEFIVDARNTRIGFDVAGPEVPFFNCAKGGGKVEIDFQNSVLSTENKATILLRHAYAEVKNEDFRVLAGQTWDVISPLNPGMLLYSVGWDGGNIGYRRAQLRGERFMKFSDVSLVSAQLSANQQVFTDGTTTLKGETSNWPVLEGRVAWTIGDRGKDGLPITIGMSGHIGEEQFDLPLVINNRRRTWSGNLDIRVPLTYRLGFQAECFTGENLDAFLGGIGQGVDPTTLNTIRSTGGWMEFWYDWAPTVHSHFGYSVDDPNDHDLATIGEKSYNQFFYGNLLYDFTKNFLVGMEISSWKTNYVGQLPGESVRCEFVAKYGF